MPRRHSSVHVAAACDASPSSPACQFAVGGLCLLPRSRTRAAAVRDGPPPPAGPAPVFTLAAAHGHKGVAHSDGAPTLAQLAARRPVALLALVPTPAVLFVAGAVAGAVGKTLTAPLDRVKLLMQTAGGLETGALAAAAQGGHTLRALAAIGRQEGLLGYWRGNTPQVLKVLPYAATQLCAYEAFKRTFADDSGQLSVKARLAAGACAGMTATLITHPLDTLRLRMAVDPRARTLALAGAALAAEGGLAAFYRGLGASLLGIAPYMALELSAFDLAPSSIPPFARGFGAALAATLVCYPLDTVRRRVQLCAAGGEGLKAVLARMATVEGLPAFYRGFVPNCIKNLPNKGVRLATFDTAKTLVGTARVALEEEEERARRGYYLTSAS